MVYGNLNQETEKKELYDKITLYEKKIQELKVQIEEINEVIVSNCVFKNGTHDYVREIDMGPYGDSYLVCKKCGYER